MGVTSSSSPDWVDGHLARLGLSAYFNCVECANDGVPAKPDPTLYLRALTALGVRADEAIAFEDSANGVMAAKRAGICCIAVPNALTRELDLAHADLRLKSLAKLSLEALLKQVSKIATTTVTNPSKHGG